VCKIQLFGQEDSIPWPAHYQNTPEKTWLEAFLRDGVPKYIYNISTQFYILQFNDCFLPLTVNEGEYDNSYVCSPFTHYISYAIEELRYLNNPALEKIIAFFLSGLGIIFKALEFNKTVHVNNWLLSTNLYPNWTTEDTETLTQRLIQRFPKHSIVFRSLNEHTEQKKLNTFQEANYKLLVSRQVYFVDGKTNTFMKKRDFKNDNALARKSKFEFTREIISSDIPRIIELYNALYLSKYSFYNPQFTSDFVQLCLDNSLLTIQGLRNAQGKLDGVIGYFERNGMMTTPLVGYNPHNLQEDGLYRLITLQALRDAKEKELLFNMSSGAGHFKRMRGAFPALEYSVVYCRHLSIFRQLPWLILEIITDKIAKPLMLKLAV
jgi:hypothetical protein